MLSVIDIPVRVENDSDTWTDTILELAFKNCEVAGDVDSSFAMQLVVVEGAEITPSIREEHFA